MATSNKDRGVYSSEFWLNAIVIVAATFLLYMDKIPAEWWTIAVLGGSGTYTLARGYVKAASGRRPVKTSSKAGVDGSNDV